MPAAVFAHTGEKTLLDENGRFRAAVQKARFQDAGARFALLRFRSPAFFYVFLFARLSPKKVFWRAFAV